jgi:hypothetical protein
MNIEESSVQYIPLYFFSFIEILGNLELYYN